MIDEGFNQIDIKLEREILLDIFRYFHDRTFIIISHRIENSDLYNRVIKIDNGFVNMIEEVPMNNQHPTMQYLHIQSKFRLVQKQ